MKKMASFKADPEWVKERTESEVHGPAHHEVESVFLDFLWTSSR